MTRFVTTCLLTIVISEYDNYSVVYISYVKYVQLPIMIGK